MPFCGLSRMQARFPLPLKVGVGQNEQPLADVRPPDFRRRYDARCNPVAHALKICGDVSETKGQMADDVLEKAPFRGDFGDDSGNVGPKVTRVRLAPPMAREREGLAGITGRDDMNAAAPRSAIEGFEVVPNRSRDQGRVRHPRHEAGRGETVSLDITHSSVSGFCDVKAKIEASDAGAKAETAKVVMPDVVRSIGGTKSHTRHPFQRGLAAAGVGSSLASDD